MSINIENGKKIYKALKSAGANNTLMPILMAQVAHETGGFNSKVLQSDNNASGIMFINEPKQKNATRGKSFPIKESKTAHYARFNTLKDWAIDFLRIIGKTPKTATSLTDYAQKLKARRYYTADTTLYAKALISWDKQLKKLDLYTTESNNLKLILPISIILGIFAFSFFRK
jgi:IS1 family transposase